MGEDASPVLSLPGPVYWFAQAAITKYHRLDGFGNVRKYISEDLKSKVKVSAGLVSPEASLLSLQMAVFSLYPPMASALCAHIPGESRCVPSPPFIRTPVRLG